MKQLIRYGLVGIATNLSMYLLYLLSTYLGIEPKMAMTLVYLLGATIGFIGHRNWTFSHRGNVTHSFAKYGIAHLCGYLLNFLILAVFVDHLGYAHQWVQGAAILIVAGFLFLLFKYFVFSKNYLAG